jgi:hypothetical protein
MKFVVSYVGREVGSSIEERVHGNEVAQKLLANWTPSGQIVQWLQRCDGTGGFAITEIDDGSALLRDLAVWSPWFEFQVTPVVDMVDAIPIQDDTLDRLRGVI